MEIAIPIDRVTVRTSRSGGPGGQNVNKVSSRVEVRFVLEEAGWIPPEVRSRVRELFPTRITGDGEFRVVSSRFRDQRRNLEDCLDRIREILRIAAHRPRPRIGTSPSRSSRRRRVEAKRRRSAIKRDRRGGGEED
jgi:ribosome-associated protein